MRLLIVEDSDLLQEQLQRLIASIAAVEIAGWAVAEDQAVEAIMQLSPEVVLLDLGLAEGSGLGVLRRMRQSGLAARVLVLTNNADAAIQQACEMLGVDGFFDKSRSFDQCLAHLARLASSATHASKPPASAHAGGTAVHAASAAPASTKRRPEGDDALSTVSARDVVPTARHDELRRTVDVCITLDIEFSINGAFGRPDRRPVGAASVWRPVVGRSEGLGFVLDALARNRLPATFFMEMLSQHHFGKHCITDIVRPILRGGHDVQLHAHPCWMTFADKTWAQGLPHVADTWVGLGTRADELLAHALDLFRRALSYDASAFRPGNLNADLNLFRALARAGIFTSSAIGLAYFEPPQADLHRFCTPSKLAGVLEVPVASYWERLPTGRRKKLLTIAGTDWATMRAMLEWAWEEGIGPIVILTHASEFADAINDPGATPTYQKNWRNQSRFESLCDFLDRHRDRFSATTFSRSRQAWTESPDREFVAPIYAPVRRAIERLLPR